MSLSKKEILIKIKNKEVDIITGRELLKKLDLKGLPELEHIEFQFNSDDAFIRDHIVMQQRVLMGVTHCSLALEAFHKLFPNKKGNVLNNISFIEAIKLNPHEKVSVDVVFEEKHNRRLFFNKFKTENSKEYFLTATGDMSYEETDQLENIDIIKYKKTIIKEIKKEDIYQKITEESYYGPSLHTLKTLWVGDKVCLAELALSEELKKDGQQYYFHPAFFDGAFVGSLFLNSIKDNYVPLFIKKINISNNTGNSCYCLIEQNKKNDEIIVVDMKFCNEDGSIVCIVEGFTNKRIGSMAAFGVVDNKVKNNPVKRSDQKIETKLVGNNNKDSLDILSSKIESYIINLIKTVINDFNKEINVKENFLELGVDSNNLIELSKKIESDIGVELYPTLFFENQNINELTTYFRKECTDGFKKYFNINIAESDEQLIGEQIVDFKNETARESQVQEMNVNRIIDIRNNDSIEENTDIAIIGMAGRFAESKNLDEFWENIVSSKDLVTEIPIDHWDYKPWFSENKDDENKTYSKWGSFITDVDKFDPLFFNISPKEAEWLDPQLRHFLEVVYETVEDAGYSNRFKGTNTSVFIGSCFHEYWDEIVRRQIPITTYEHNSSAMSSLSGRVSYTFDLCGASIPLDNACASSLTALHLACQSLKSGECSMAVVGGLNLLLSPLHYVYFSRIGALSPTGRCHTFDKQADGYVPGEGIVAVLVKPLNRAKIDKDNIHAVIKGSAINHVGHSSNPTSPRPEAQTNVILNAFSNSKVSPDTITYVEAHGTGTALGDPIEINALKKAFSIYTKQKDYCLIGSSKAHVGHLEGAAGLSSVIKVVLQMKHNKIPAMPNFKEINPYIVIKDSPFIINKENHQWVVPTGTLRRAGVSSFGMTGNNAHIILEEYVEDLSIKILKKEMIKKIAGPYVFVLSAKNEERLNEYVLKFEKFISNQLKIEKKDKHQAQYPIHQLSDIAYTLQVGRESMDERLSFVVTDKEELIAKLTGYIKKNELPGLMYGNIKNNKNKVDPIYKLHHEMMIDEIKGTSILEQRNKMEVISAFWCKGFEIDWELLYAHSPEEEKPRRISLPTYPFDKKRYWIPQQEDTGKGMSITDYKKLHSIIDRNESTLEEQRYIKVLTKDDFYIRDHVVGETYILPGVGYVEMARAAGEMAGGKELKYVRNVIWAVPVAVSEKGQEIEIGLYPSEKEDGIQYEIRSYLDGNQVIHSQGKLEYSSTSSLQVKSKGSINIEEIIGRLEKRADKEGIYKQFSQLGLNYGKTFQVIRELYGNETESLSRLELSEEVTGLEKLILHPSIMDGALQSTIGIGEWVGTYLPFTMKELEIIKPTEETCYVHARLMVTNSSEIKKYNIDIYDKAGELLVGIKEFVAKSVDLTQMKVERKKADAELVETEGDYYKTVWESCNIGPNEENNEKGSIIIFDREDGLYKEYKKHNPEGHVVLIKTGEKYEQLSDDIYGIDENEYSDYQKVAEIIKEKNVKRIIHMWNYNDKEILLTNQKQLTEELNTGIYSIFQLSKAMLAAKLKEGIKLLYISHESKESIQPYNSAISGFIKTIKQENPKYDYHSIRIDKKDIIAEELYEITRNEFHNGKESEVKYENNKRLIRKIIPLPIVQSSNHPIIQNNAVILITGGMGGLGLIFAKYLSEKYKAKLILTGRSAIDEKKETLLKEIRALGGDAIYIQADVTDVDSLKQGIEQAKQQLAAHHGPISINGVIHSAGIIKDDFIIKKDFSVFKEVISPKIQGTINLYEATKEENLEFIVFFSSISASLGNMGQSDYAFANAFMNDSVVWFTNQSSNTCQIMSVGWPLWRDGGMQIDEEVEKMLMRNLGMKILETEIGIKALEEIITCSEQHVIVVPGDREKIYDVLKIKEIDKIQNMNQSMVLENKGIEYKQSNGASGLLQNELINMISDILKLNASDIDIETNISEYGVDSISITAFTNKVNDKYRLELTPATFFEYQELKSLANYIFKEYSSEISEYYREHLINEEEKDVSAKEIFDKIESGNKISFNKMPTKYKEYREHKIIEDEIAIIGMSGVFPGSKDLEEFWFNLESGFDLITTIPENRVELSEYYKGTTDNNIKGGFIGDIDKFDPFFFNISPREACLMDPQQRIFLETVWKSIEDAGYKASDLSGSKTGVFVGVGTSDYTQIISEKKEEIEAYTSTGLAHSVLANRVSYILNINGPSIPIDTACSSSLVAIYRAVQSMQNNDCEMAIVGGVNALLTPDLFISFGKAGMLSPDGKCKTFDSRADGYVRGEGVGAVLLKSFAKAKNDGDHIYAVIKGAAENHGGRVSSLTVPNPNAQTELIINACTRGNINPDTISYIEAHGTGTNLGDPIEINGLKKAFKELNIIFANNKPKINYCGLGAVKTNIGHLETAAGIAGVIKVLLMMKYKKIPGLVNYKEKNPYIDITESPFYIVEKTKEWERFVDEKDESIPRRAGISSFGFGGSNAHVLLEEYIDDTELYRLRDQQNKQCSYIIILSAKNEERLKEYSVKLMKFLSNKQVQIQHISDVAYTLQIGRESMDERLSVVVHNKDDLISVLSQYIDGKAGHELFQGNVKKNTERESPIYNLHHQQLIKELAEDGLGDESYKTKLAALAELFVKGFEIDWKLLYKNLEEKDKPQRISLPTYPFEKKRYWINNLLKKTQGKEFAPAHNSRKKIGPLIDRNIVSLPIDGLNYEKEFRKEDKLITDHVINGKGILPGVCHIEMILESMIAVKGMEHITIQDIVWIQPLIVSDVKKININLKGSGNLLTYEIYEWNNDEKRIYSSGTVCNETRLLNKEQYINIDEIRQRCSQKLDKSTIYNKYKKIGIEYGKYFQGVEDIYIGEQEVLGELNLPDEYLSEMQLYQIHPMLMDGALQTVIGFYIWGNNKAEALLPFSIDKLYKLSEMTPKMYSYIKKIAANIYDIMLINESGMLCQNIQGFKVKSLQMKAEIVPPSFLYYPTWEQSQLLISKKDSDITSIKKNVLMIYPEKSMGIEKQLRDINSGNDIYEIKITSDISIEQRIKEIGALNTIYFFGGIQQEHGDRDVFEVLAQSQESGVLALFRLVKTLIKMGYDHREIELKVVTNNVHHLHNEDNVIPYSGNIFGFVKSLAKEYPSWKISCMDISLTSIKKNSNKEIKEQLVELIANELADQDGNEILIRNGIRYIQKIYPLELEEINHEQFKHEGVYLLIGGAGGIGLELSKYLIEKVQAKIIWVGRSKQSIEIDQKIKQLSINGAHVIYLEADICDYKQMKSVISIVKETYGTINGIFHMAIVLKDKLIANMDEETLKSVMAPKVKGTVVLDKVLEGEKIDFVIFFSSAQSFAGNIGQSNYASACTFKDAYSKYMSRKASYDVKTINWGYWGRIGIVATDEYRKKLADQGIFSIEAEEGMNTLEYLLSTDIKQILPIKGETKILERLGIDFGNKAKIYSELMESKVVNVISTHEESKISAQEIKRQYDVFKELELFSENILLWYFQKNGLFKTLGEEFTRNQIESCIGLIPKYKKLLTEILSILESSGYLERLKDGNLRITDKINIDGINENDIKMEKDKLITQCPEIKTHINLVWECVNSYSDVLNGGREYADVMFPGGSMELVEGIYKGNILTDYYNTLVANLIKRYIEIGMYQDKKTKVNIVEIGSGTGGTSAFVLDAIKEYSENITYLYTDVSIGFTKYGTKEFGQHYSFMDSQVLDIESDPTSQGVAGNSVDIVFGTNVFHATKNINNTLQQVKKLLKKNGLIIINEITKKQNFATLTFGLTDGWWLYEDDKNRIEGCPLLNEINWEEILYINGYGDARFLNFINEHVDNPIQNTIIGESNGVAVYEQNGINEKRNIHAEDIAVRVKKETIKDDGGLDQNILKQIALNYVKNVFSDVLGLAKEYLDEDAKFDKYGVDSIIIMEINKIFNRDFNHVPSTILFENTTVTKLADYFVKTHPTKLTELDLGKENSHDSLDQDNSKNSGKTNEYENKIKTQPDNHPNHEFKEILESFDTDNLMYLLNMLENNNK